MMEHTLTRNHIGEKHDHAKPKFFIVPDWIIGQSGTIIISVFVVPRV